MSVPESNAPPVDSGLLFYSSGSGTVSAESLDVSGGACTEGSEKSINDLLKILAYDGISLFSMVKGVGAVVNDNDEDSHVLSDHLTKLLFVASEIAPVETADILLALLLIELDDATRGRNNALTFMRGNGVVPRVFEEIMTNVTSASGGLRDELLNCCTALGGVSHAPRWRGDAIVTENDDGGRFTDSSFIAPTAPVKEGEGACAVPFVDLLLEGLDYFKTEVKCQLDSVDDLLKNQEVYVETVLAMLHSILDVVHASVNRWPWSLRKCLSSFLKIVERRTRNEAHLVGLKGDAMMLVSLGQNMISTIVVLRAVIPALLAIVPRLAPEGGVFDGHHSLVHRRCMMLAKLIQKAAHGLLFDGEHEERNFLFNKGLPTLTQRWVTLFGQICQDPDPPSARQDKFLLKQGMNITMRLCEFIDTHLFHLVHVVIRHRPVMEPVFLSHAMRLTGYSERRLKSLSRLALLSPSVESPHSVVIVDPISVLSHGIRRARSLLPPSNPLRSSTDVLISGTVDSASNIISKPRSRREEIFYELLSYALNLMVHPEITGLYASFCGVAGVACDDTSAIYVYWDLLRVYLDMYYAGKVKEELQRRCPQFSRYRRRTSLRDGDSLAFLFLLVDLAMTEKCQGGFRLVVLARHSATCCVWLRDALQLLPEKHAARCAGVFMLNSADPHSLHGEWDKPFKVTVLRRAKDLLLALENLSLCIPLGYAEYRMLLEEEKEAGGEGTEPDGASKGIAKIFFPPTSSRMEDKSEPVGVCSWFTLGFHVSLDACKARIWPLELLRDVFELICAVIRPACMGVTAAAVEGHVVERLVKGVPSSIISNFRMKAVEFFFDFEGDLLLHMEIKPKWLSDTPRSRPHGIGHTKDEHNDQSHIRHRSPFFSWFSSVNVRDGEMDAHESSLLHILFLATRHLCGSDDHSIGSRSAIRVDGHSSFIPSLRHTTLESLWRLLIYNLWNTFDLMQQVSPLLCPVTCMVKAVRMRSEEEQHESLGIEKDNLFGGENTSLDAAAAAAALAAVPLPERELIRLLVEICAFIRQIDFDGLGSVTGKHCESDGFGGRVNALAGGVIRIIYRKKGLDNAELFVAQLIALQGEALLLEAARLSA